MLNTLQQHPILKKHCTDGLKVIETKHRPCIQIKYLQVSCSLNIDEAYREAEPQNNRWDYYIYVIDDNNVAYAVFFEPHACTTKEVSCFLEKYRWLMDKLNRSLSFLIKDTKYQHYFWIPSSVNKIARHLRQYKLLMKTKIRIVKVIYDHDLTQES